MKLSTILEASNNGPTADIMVQISPPKSVMKCFKILSKFAKSLTCGASISWGHSRLPTGRNKYIHRAVDYFSKWIVGENRASWSDKLDDALWAFRTAYKTPIGCTPYKLDTKGSPTTYPSRAQSLLGLEACKL
ncbi:hypothetical protein Tco_0741789 [Tanacetum coccineum]|uniref:Reverse transcriptase domain-containing protein n=1 Tax=Tanacetum coccineum TaxID=301880 RepID=A0ABQ5AXR1_9ASTR